MYEIFSFIISVQFILRKPGAWNGYFNKQWTKTNALNMYLAKFSKVVL